MGAWGVNAFDNDDAEDIRDIYDKGIADGMSVDNVTRTILDKYRDDISKNEVAIDIYLAIAMLQWKGGNLSDSIYQKVAELADDEKSYSLWENTPDYHRRKSAVSKALKKLAKPRRPSRGRRPRKAVSKGIIFECGNCYEYTLGEAEKYILVCVRSKRGGNRFVVVNCKTVNCGLVITDEMCYKGIFDTNSALCIEYDFDDSESSHRIAPLGINVIPKCALPEYPTWPMSAVALAMCLRSASGRLGNSQK